MKFHTQIKVFLSATILTTFSVMTIPLINENLSTQISSSLLIRIIIVILPSIYLNEIISNLNTCPSREAHKKFKALYLITYPLVI
jgi:preprotein translocase subunit SecF